MCGEELPDATQVAVLCGHVQRRVGHAATGSVEVRASLDQLIQLGPLVLSVVGAFLQTRENVHFWPKITQFRFAGLRPAPRWGCPPQTPHCELISQLTPLAASE